MSWATSLEAASGMTMQRNEVLESIMVLKAIFPCRRVRNALRLNSIDYWIPWGTIQCGVVHEVRGLTLGVLGLKRGSSALCEYMKQEVAGSCLEGHHRGCSLILHYWTFVRSGRCHLVGRCCSPGCAANECLGWEWRTWNFDNI